MTTRLLNLPDNFQQLRLTAGLDVLEFIRSTDVSECEMLDGTGTITQVVDGTVPGGVADVATAGTDNSQGIANVKGQFIEIGGSEMLPVLLEGRLWCTENAANTANIVFGLVENPSGLITDGDQLKSDFVGGVLFKPAGDSYFWIATSDGTTMKMHKTDVQLAAGWMTLRIITEPHIPKGVDWHYFVDEGGGQHPVEVHQLDAPPHNNPPIFHNIEYSAPIWPYIIFGGKNSTADVETTRWDYLASYVKRGGKTNTALLPAATA